MNKGDQLPDTHHVARGCGRGFINNRVTSAAFSPRPQDKNCLSVDWVECERVDPTLRNNDGIIQRSRLPVRPQKLAILNNGEIRKISVQDISLDVIYFPSKRNQCHSRISGMTGIPADQDLQQGLADLANRSTIVELPSN